MFRVRVEYKHFIGLLRACLLAALPILAVSCATTNAPEVRPRDPQALNLLFIGNSLSSNNDLPGLLAALADSAGLGPLSVTNVSVGGYGLQDHWVRSQTRNALAAGGWDLVILQQGPSATEGRPSLLEYSARFAEEARGVGAEVALYMVWPSLSRFHDFDGVFSSYLAAATQVDGLFFPSGESWRVAWETQASLPLYGLDDFHPTRLGTYAAALVMFQQITGHSPVGLPSTVRTGGNQLYDLNAADAALVQAAAAEANRRHARSVEGWPPAD